MSTNSARAAITVDSRQGLLAELAVIDAEGWEGRTADRLLSYVRTHMGAALLE